MTHPLTGKTTVAVLTMLALLAIPYASPRLARFRVAKAPWQAGDKDEAPAATAPVPAPALSTGETSLKASSNDGTIANALPAEATTPALDPAVLAKTAGSLAVEDPERADGSRALDAFYARLARTQDKEPGATTPILHYGDSVIASDYISGTLRRKFGQKYGDGGHGFILVANAWEWYFHNDVVHYATEGWNANRITGPLSKDGAYGLGGVTFHGYAGASATFGTTDKGDFGRKVSRFDVYYMEQPNGGDATVTIGSETTRFSSKGDAKASRKKSFTVPDGPAKMTLKAVGNGDFRCFGVVMERDEPGVSYDALGALGARMRLWEAQDEAHWKEQMELRQPGLVVLQFGTNESEDGWFATDVYEKTVRTVIEKLKRAAPASSILILAPLDRAEKADDGSFKSKKIIKRLLDSQRKVAKEQEVAFWDTFTAMGGEGSMARWVKATPQLASWDLTHPTPAGAEVIGDLLFKALSSGLEAFRSRHPKGLAPRASGSAAPSAARSASPAPSASAP